MTKNLKKGDKTYRVEAEYHSDTKDIAYKLVEYTVVGTYDIIRRDLDGTEEVVSQEIVVSDGKNESILYSAAVSKEKAIAEVVQSLEQSLRYADEDVKYYTEQLNSVTEEKAKTQASLDSLKSLVVE